MLTGVIPVGHLEMLVQKKKNQQIQEPFCPEEQNQNIRILFKTHILLQLLSFQTHFIQSITLLAAMPMGRSKLTGTAGGRTTARSASASTGTRTAWPPPAGRAASTPSRSLGSAALSVKVGVLFPLLCIWSVMVAAFLAILGSL